MEPATYVFEDEERPLRVILRDGAPWFIARDVCTVLGIQNVSQALDALDEDERGICSTYTPRQTVSDDDEDAVSSAYPSGGPQEMLVVSESGLYTLILRSRQATAPGSVAHRFRRWVTGEVLPAIRKTGRHAPPDPTAEWDWQAIHDKVQLVREARLTLGRKAAATLYVQLKLPAPVEEELLPAGPATLGLDFVRQFLADCTIEARGASVQASHLYAAWEGWAKRNEAPSMTATAFGLCLPRLGIGKQRRKVVLYHGIRLRHVSEQLG